jgi:hypothetical protein
MNEMTNLTNFEWLFKWFYQQCDGDWEHGKGVRIGTLDNPGWYITINIAETELEKKEFQKVFIQRTEDDWFFCTRRDGVFEGDCGPFNLPEVLQTFRDWAESNQES